MLNYHAVNELIFFQTPINNDQGHKDIIHQYDTIKNIMFCVSTNRSISTPKTKYALSVRYKQKRTYLNTKDYYVKLYQVNTSMANCTDL